MGIAYIWMGVAFEYSDAIMPDSRSLCKWASYQVRNGGGNKPEPIKLILLSSLYIFQSLSVISS
jgi:hypothetical protein